MVQSDIRRRVQHGEPPFCIRHAVTGSLEDLDDWSGYRVVITHPAGCRQRLVCENSEGSQWITQWGMHIRKSTNMIAGCGGSPVLCGLEPDEVGLASTPRHGDCVFPMDCATNDRARCCRWVCVQRAAQGGAAGRLPVLERRRNVGAMDFACCRRSRSALGLDNGCRVRGHSANGDTCVRGRRQCTRCQEPPGVGGVPDPRLVASGWTCARGERRAVDAQRLGAVDCAPAFSGVSARGPNGAAHSVLARR
jgi:hypothetical protein